MMGKYGVSINGTIKEEKMAKCKECRFFFPIPEDADDFKPGKGDCVTERRDKKGKYWLAKPVYEDTDSCEYFVKRV